MELRQYLQLVRRRKLLILTTTLLAMLVAGFLTLRAEPVYEATTQVLLLPNDPAERVTDAPNGPFDAGRYAAAQVSLLLSSETAAAAAQQVEGVDVEEVREAVDAEQSSDSDIILVTAVHPSPETAAAISNAVVNAYIENRRLAAVQNLQTAVDQIGGQLRTLQARIGQLREQADDRPGTDAEENLDAANIQYAELYGRQQDLLLDISLKRGEARVVEPAEVPEDPTGTSLPAALVLGGLAGLMAGLGLAYVRDQFDDRLRSPSEVEQLTGLPVLAEIPLDARAAREDHLTLVTDSMGAGAEAVRSLRTGISFLGIDQPVHRLMVSSAVPGDGKTFVTANLAAAFAQAGLRTVVVSADLRRPRLEAFFDVAPGTAGLTQVLSVHSRMRNDSRDASREDRTRALVQAKLQDALLPTLVADLMLLPSGPCPPNPAEMLSSPRMDDVLDLLEDQFDMVVLDTSPLLPVTDAAALAPKVGSVLLVTSMTSSRRRELERMTTTVQRTHSRVLGVVANKVKRERGAAASYESTAIGGLLSGDGSDRLRDGEPSLELADTTPLPVGTAPYAPQAAVGPADAEQLYDREATGEEAAIGEDWDRAGRPEIAEPDRLSLFRSARPVEPPPAVTGPPNGSSVVVGPDADQQPELDGRPAVRYPQVDLLPGGSVTDSPQEPPARTQPDSAAPASVGWPTAPLGRSDETARPVTSGEDRPWSSGGSARY